MPEIIVMDPGTEFKAHVADMCNGNGTIVLPTDPRAPWQNGRTERAGKEWKAQFKLAMHKEAPPGLSRIENPRALMLLRP